MTHLDHTYSRGPYARLFRREAITGRTLRETERQLRRIGRLYGVFEGRGDRAGQHACELAALRLRNNARRRGNLKGARAATVWLVCHE